MSELEEEGAAILQELHELCTRKGVTEEDAEMFVSCIRTLGRVGAGLESSTIAELDAIDAKIDDFLQRYPQMQRATDDGA